MLGICCHHVSVTCQYCIKIAKLNSMQTVRQDSLGTLVSLMPKILVKLERNHRWGHQMQVGYVKIGYLRQITCCNLKMVQDRRMAIHPVVSYHSHLRTI